MAGPPAKPPGQPCLVERMGGEAPDPSSPCTRASGLDDEGFGTEVFDIDTYWMEEMAEVRARAQPLNGAGLRHSQAGALERSCGDEDEELPMGMQKGGSSCSGCPAALRRSQALKDVILADIEAVSMQNVDYSVVWVHVYHTDPYTAWLNWAGLKYAQVPIYHAGVEVYGIEWAFQYYDDAWHDDSISGVVSCQPKRMQGYDYQESICLGSTPLSVTEVRVLMEVLRKEWPACAYHISRHNCLTFAQAVVERLRVSEPFPPFLLGFGDAPKYIPITDAIVDYGWGWYKWGLQKGCHKPQVMTFPTFRVQPCHQVSQSCHKVSRLCHCHDEGRLRSDAHGVVLELEHPVGELGDPPTFVRVFTEECEAGNTGVHIPGTVDGNKTDGPSNKAVL